MQYRTPSRRAVIVASASVAVAAATALVAWAFRAPRTRRYPLRIARLATPHSGLLLLAERKGFFDREGLDVEVLTVPTGYEAIERVLAGTADIGAAAETPIARALAEGKTPVVLTTIFTSQWNSGVVGRKDLGVHQPEHLRGKRIGFVFGTATHYMLEAFLAFHGIQVEEVDLVRMPPDALHDAITTGKVAAAAAWTPFLSRIQDALGANGTTFLPRDFYAETFNLVSRPSFPERNRVAVVALMRALVAAESFARQAPDAALDVISEASGTPAQALRQGGQPLTFELSLRPALRLALDNEIDWFYRRGMVQRGASAPDVAAAIDPEPLRSVSPRAVGIGQP